MNLEFKFMMGNPIYGFLFICKINENKYVLKIHYLNNYTLNLCNANDYYMVYKDYIVMSQKENFENVVIFDCLNKVYVSNKRLINKILKKINILENGISRKLMI